MNGPSEPTHRYTDGDPAWSQYFRDLEDYEAAVTCERVLATAVQLAIRQDRADLAFALLDCEIVELRPNQDDRGRVTVDIVADVEAFRTLQSENAPQGDWDDRFPSRLWYFFEDILPPGMTLYEVAVRPRLADASDGWRERVKASVEGQASNQGTAFGTSQPILHNGLYYRSKSEVRVAEKLEMVDGLLFFPNPGAMSRGVQKEPDFLIFYKGKVGVLEVDGPTHRGRAADDSARDSYFQKHGLFVKRYPSETCYEQPETVVKSFLGLLVKS